MPDTPGGVDRFEQRDTAAGFNDKRTTMRWFWSVGAALVLAR
jgi:hypothetical protein